MVAIATPAMGATTPKGLRKANHREQRDDERRDRHEGLEIVEGDVRVGLLDDGRAGDVNLGARRERPAQLLGAGRQRADGVDARGGRRVVEVEARDDRGGAPVAGDDPPGEQVVGQDRGDGLAVARDLGGDRGGQGIAARLGGQRHVGGHAVPGRGRFEAREGVGEEARGDHGAVEVRQLRKRVDLLIVDRRAGPEPGGEALRRVHHRRGEDRAREIVRRPAARAVAGGGGQDDQGGDGPAVVTEGAMEVAQRLLLVARGDEQRLEREVGQQVLWRPQVAAQPRGQREERRQHRPARLQEHVVEAPHRPPSTIGGASARAPHALRH